MKKLFFCLLLILISINVCSFNVFSASNNKTYKNAKNKTLIINDKDKIKKYAISKELKNTNDIIEIVLFIDESRISSDVSRRNLFSKKFYSKNTKTSIFTDYSSIINSDVFPAGKVKYEYFNIGDVVKCSPCSNAKDAFSSLKLKYIENSKIKNIWSDSFSSNVIIKIYPIYKQYKFELWEDDIFFDDNIGNCKLWKAIGYEIIVYKAS